MYVIKDNQTKKFIGIDQSSGGYPVTGGIDLAKIWDEKEKALSYKDTFKNEDWSLFKIELTPETWELIGELKAVGQEPFVSIGTNTYPLVNCNLTRHSFDYWIFNMNLGGNYSAWKEGDKVTGHIINGKFYAWNEVK